jgi:hypothetical protein
VTTTEGTQPNWIIPEGTEIRSADDAKLGKAVTTNPEYVVVEKGFLFPTDYYIPTTAIASYDGETARLSVTKDEVLHQGWDRQPDTAVATPVAPVDILPPIEPDRGTG